MLQSIHTPDASSELITRLSHLGKCEYTCKWAGKNNYYDNSIITNDNSPCGSGKKYKNAVFNLILS